MSQPAHEEEGFGLSIGDVMSALLLIIILLMMNIVYKLSEEVDNLRNSTNFRTAILLWR